MEYDFSALYGKGASFPFGILISMGNFNIKFLTSFIHTTIGT
jgi:hypothetical protein